MAETSCHSSSEDTPKRQSVAPQHTSNDETRSERPMISTIRVPMPTPGSPHAPHFKGKRVRDFLDSLEAHALAAHLPNERLSQYVLRYCHSSIKRVIESSVEIGEGDWTCVREYMIDLYSSNDKTPPITSDRLRAWVRQHANKTVFKSEKDVDKYYRKFIAQSNVLTSKGLLLNADADRLFYQGIPHDLRKKIRAKLPVEQTKTVSPPPLVNVLRLLRAEYDEEDIDAEIETVGFNNDLCTDSSSESEEDFDGWMFARSKKKQQDSKVETDNKRENLVSQESSMVESLAKQVQDLLQNQATLKDQLSLREASINDRRCYMCDQVGSHRLGISHCPETNRLIDEGLIKYSDRGKIVRTDSSPLPRAQVGNGGIAHTLREERSQNKGKFVEGRPLLSTSHVGLMYNGRDVLSDRTVGIASVDGTHLALPVTRSQVKKDNRWDPLRRPEDKNRQPDLNTREPASQARVPAAPPNTQDRQDVRMNIEEQPTRPHPANTEEGWREQVRAKKQAAHRDEGGKAKGAGWHYTSQIQESIDGDDVQEKILGTTVTLSIKEILGISADLQKRFTNLTKTKRSENVAKNACIHFEDNGDVENAPFVPETMQISFDDNQDTDNVATRYSSAIMLEPPSILAWMTGRFEAVMAGRRVKCMIDTGSELNLISDTLFRQTSLPLETDGVKWSLKGINGEAVPMIGLLRNVPVDIGGHRFDHHFFVSAEGTGNQEVILGQPWLQWYSANIGYTRQGQIVLRLWKNGCTSICPSIRRNPTITIQLATADVVKTHNQSSRMVTMEEYDGLEEEKW
ncbi:hypothetical protein AX17_004207 [Amanita inopinata Kibby_2008]|nr:hypothetical protein AX17_004207 [Amanita inopinata Kibby_2008]